MAKLSENLALLAADGDDVGDEEEDTRGRRREDEGGSTVAGCMNAAEQSNPAGAAAVWSVDGSVIRAGDGGTKAQRHVIGAKSRSWSSLAAGCVRMAGGNRVIGSGTGLCGFWIEV
jgi:hypothetical protein